METSLCGTMGNQHAAMGCSFWTSPPKVTPDKRTGDLGPGGWWQAQPELDDKTAKKKATWAWTAQKKRD